MKNCLKNLVHYSSDTKSEHGALYTKPDNECLVLIINKQELNYSLEQKINAERTRKIQSPLDNM